MHKIFVSCIFKLNLIMNDLSSMGKWSKMGDSRSLMSLPFENAEAVKIS